MWRYICVILNGAERSEESRIKDSCIRRNDMIVKDSCPAKAGSKDIRRNDNNICSDKLKILK